MNTHTTSTTVDYDTLAATYNLRFSGDHDRPKTAWALEALALRQGARDILEVGCGTGRWLDALAGTAHRGCGLDPSTGMLAQAQKRGSHIPLTRGRGEILPFADATFDMVYCVNVIHHMTEPRAFIREAWRVLRPGGTCAIIGTDPRGRRESWYVYDYFDGVYETDLARFPSWETVLDWMTCTGFQQFECQNIESIIDHKKGRDVLDDLFLQKHATSQLALLSDTAYARGLDKLKAAVEAAETRGDAIIFPVEIVIKMLSGQRL